MNDGHTVDHHDCAGNIEEFEIEPEPDNLDVSCAQKDNPGVAFDTETS